MTSLRIFFIGGLISFRALFNWLSPWVYIPSMLVAPIVQILLFAYMGRAAGVESDEFYVIGNAVQYSAIPCLFAMANTVAGERWTQTLGIVLVTPANRRGALPRPVAARGGQRLLRVDVLAAGRLAAARRPAARGVVAPRWRSSSASRPSRAQVSGSPTPPSASGCGRPR